MLPFFLPLVPSFIYLTASDFSIKLEGHLWVQNLFRILKIVFSFFVREPTLPVLQTEKMSLFTFTECYIDVS